MSKWSKISYAHMICRYVTYLMLNNVVTNITVTNSTCKLYVHIIYYVVWSRKRPLTLNQLNGHLWPNPKNPQKSAYPWSSWEIKFDISTKISEFVGVVTIFARREVSFDQLLRKMIKIIESKHIQITIKARFFAIIWIFGYSEVLKPWK